MRQPLALLGFIAIAAIAAVSCSSATSTPPAADAGVGVAMHDAVADLGGNDVVDTGTMDTGADDDASGTEDVVAPDLASDATAFDADTADVEAGGCAPGAACSAPCCVTATCTSAGVCKCIGVLCDDQNPCTVDLCDAATCSWAVRGHLAGATASPCGGNAASHGWDRAPQPAS